MARKNDENKAKNVDTPFDSDNKKTNDDLSELVQEESGDNDNANGQSGSNNNN